MSPPAALESSRMEKHEPEFKDLWLLVVFFGAGLLFFLLTCGMTPSDHGAYWREVTAMAFMMGFMFTVLAGLVRPAGWLALLGMLASIYLLPHIRATNLQLYFAIANYFTLFFSLGDRLTLSKILKLALFSGLWMGYAYFVDPSVEAGDFGQGVLGWFSLGVLLVVVNAALRIGKRGLKPGRLDWQNET
jgi:hypothetical protein